MLLQLNFSTCKKRTILAASRYSSTRVSSVEHSECASVDRHRVGTPDPIIHTRIDDKNDVPYYFSNNLLVAKSVCKEELRQKISEQQMIAVGKLKPGRQRDGRIINKCSYRSPPTLHKRVSSDLCSQNSSCNACFGYQSFQTRFYFFDNIFLISCKEIMTERKGFEADFLVLKSPIYSVELRIVAHFTLSSLLCVTTSSVLLFFLEVNCQVPHWINQRVELQNLITMGFQKKPHLAFGTVVLAKAVPWLKNALKHFNDTCITLRNIIWDRQDTSNFLEMCVLELR
ncbi:hypothetical protein PsorP6_011218 [Peronosclerospora sorghi]|uniref:Uncharacterized protein n=1 Tax=Peronosclerospora sorghi TaxID=230839 RepID=A0ACC0VVY7_9STRA|nr:hypothetical protein PsorP6_011218 [Peronosclerospora sorghi]